MNKFKGIKSVKNMNVLRALWVHRQHMGTMLKQVLAGTYRMSFMTMIAAVAALLYILSPIDFVPDFIPVAGWLDDGAVFYFLLKRLLTETETWLLKNNKMDKIHVIG